MDVNVALEVLQAVMLVMTIVRTALELWREVRKTLEEDRHREG